MPPADLHVRYGLPSDISDPEWEFVLPYLCLLPEDAGRREHGLCDVLDGLRWLKRWRCERVVVNTQLQNGAALALYESLGFTREPSGLSVLSLGLDR